MKTSSAYIAQLALPALLTGCITAPDMPELPASPILADTYAAMDAAYFATSMATAEWWTNFNDPVLNQLIERALIENKQIAIAEANVTTARALLEAQRLGGSYSTQSTASASLDRAPREAATTDITIAGTLGASWEYDAFGRIAAEIESAAFDLKTAEENQRDLAVIVAAETALAYINLRGNQVRLAVATANSNLQGDSLELLKTLFENGRATRLDMERAESQYRTTLASLPLLETNIQRAARQLLTLTGQIDGDLSSTLLNSAASPATIPQAPTQIAVVTPAELLRRRPDIRAAEAAIASRLALSEAERARLFPTLTFSANILSLFAESKAVENSFGFGIGPALRWDGPDLRRVRADIAVSDARTQAAFATYENVVINALDEVETALIGYVQEQSRRANLEAAAVSARRAVDLSRLRFEEGLDDFLDVIDAQRTLLDSQDRLESSRLASTQQAIAIYRALGGVWTAEALPPTRNAGVQANDP